MKDVMYASVMPEAHIDAVTASIAGVVLSAAIMSSAGNYATKSTQGYATWQADLQADNVEIELLGTAHANRCGP
ncbi:hypothetical protein [Nguyenibacter vanlangensis]|uniref:Uncharacterized protein n=1 Tax=Nguyenibacter vanlangensis TaxID=1216886 RepID=A0A7Y7M640_9PROT|nr:hypothetical protein [Nguyenibacter vanlangensis]NVN12595.1 hypothetical protein [Nguyenibacter vanlangensis]